jgi:hypothetical protein
VPYRHESFAAEETPRAVSKKAAHNIGWERSLRDMTGVGEQPLLNDRQRRLRLYTVQCAPVNFAGTLETTGVTYVTSLWMYRGGGGAIHIFLQVFEQLEDGPLSGRL